MKIPICQLFLPPLLLLFCYHSLTAEHAEVDANNQHIIYEMSPVFKVMRSNLEVNDEKPMDDSQLTNYSRTDFPCPESAFIAPCTCTNDTDFRVYLDCTFIASVDQLVEVFQREFPVKELYQFSMANNSVVTCFPSFMNGITFQNVYLNPGPFILADITDHFFFDLKDTLNEFVIVNSNLTTDSFPFFMLPSMNQLADLSIDFSGINWIPQIRAPQLEGFALEHSPFELLVKGTFPIGTGPMTISLSGNQIHSIEVGSFFFDDQTGVDSIEHIRIDLQNNMLRSLMTGTFPLRKGPMMIYLSSNRIAVIEPGTFVFPTSTSTASNESIVIDLQFNQLQSLEASTFPLRNCSMTIVLSYNRISSIEPGTFVLPASAASLTLNLDLEGNELKTVDEAVFGSIMPFITSLVLNDNPLTCGCDMAWLILNETFLAAVNASATCEDGTYLYELDPQEFIDFC